MIKSIQGKIKERYSPLYGCGKPFGPFINRQLGMRDPTIGSSASVSCNELRTIKRYLETGTSFAGLYVESLPVRLILICESIDSIWFNDRIDLHPTCWDFTIPCRRPARGSHKTAMSRPNVDQGSNGLHRNRLRQSRSLARSCTTVLL